MTRKWEKKGTERRGRGARECQTPPEQTPTIEVEYKIKGNNIEHLLSLMPFITTITRQ